MAIATCSLVAGAGHGNCARHATDRAARTETGRESAIETEPAAGIENHREGNHRHDGRLQHGERSCPEDQREGERGAEQHDAGLDVVFDAETGIHPCRKRQQVGKDEPDDERDKRRFEIIGTSLLPLPDHEDRKRGEIEEQKGGEKIAKLPTHRPRT